MRRIILGLLLAAAAMLLLPAGISVKRGPASPTQVHEATFAINDNDTDIGECVLIYVANATQSCSAIPGKTTIPVYEPNYSTVVIHRVICYYEDGALLETTDSLTMCVSYIEAGDPAPAAVDTASCVTFDDDDDDGVQQMAMTSWTTASIIPSNEFGLAMRVTAEVIDTAANFQGACVVEYSGAN